MHRSSGVAKLTTDADGVPGMQLQIRVLGFLKTGQMHGTCRALEEKLRNFT